MEPKNRKSGASKRGCYNLWDLGLYQDMLDGKNMGLRPETMDDFESHLQECISCQDLLGFVRATRKVSKNEGFREPEENSKPGLRVGACPEPWKLERYQDGLNGMKEVHRKEVEDVEKHLSDCSSCRSRLVSIQAERADLTEQKKEAVLVACNTDRLWGQLEEALKEAGEELSRWDGQPVWAWRSSNGLLSVNILNFRLLFISGELGLENMSFYFRSCRNSGEKLVFSPRKTGGGVAAGSIEFRFRGGVSLSIL